MEDNLREIAEKLAAAGMDEAHVSASVTALKDAYASVPEDELPEKLAKSGGVDGIVAQILKAYDAGRERAAAAAAAEPAPEADQPEEPAEGPAQPEDDPRIEEVRPDDAGGDLRIEEVAPEDDQGEEKPEEKEQPGKEGVGIISLDDDMFSDEAEDVAPAEEGETDVESIVETIENGADEHSSAEEFFDEDLKAQQDEKKRKPAKKSDTLAHQKSVKKTDKSKKSIKNMSTKAKTAYFIGLVFLIPLLIAIVIVITVLLLALYAAIIALVIAFSVALVIVAAAGTALSLMAIIYGVIQIAQGYPAPIGIFEIGLGITVGGATLGISIILYNFIVRFAPFLFKKMFVLYKFLFRQLTKLLSFVKGACSKL